MKKKLYIILMLLIVPLLIVGCGKSNEEAIVEEVDLSEEIKIVEAFGTLKAEETLDVYFDFPAVVKDVFVVEGQKIHLQDRIFALDISKFQTEIKNLEARLNILKLEREKIQKTLGGISIENRNSQIEKITNDLALAEKVYQQALADAVNHKALYQSGGISNQELLKVEMNATLEENKVNALAYELSRIKEVNSREIKDTELKKSLENDSLRIQNQRILSGEYELNTLKDTLNKDYINDDQVVCHFDRAVIYGISYGAGNMVDSSVKAFSIADLDSLVVDADVVEEFSKDVRIGSPVKIIPVADRTREYNGTVTYISSMAFKRNNETVINVRISIEDADDFLIPNYNVDVFIEL